MFLHAVNTTGREFFASIVLTMMNSGIPVTTDSFDEEVHSYLRIAAEQNNLERYYSAMLAHAFFDRWSALKSTPTNSGEPL